MILPVTGVASLQSTPSGHITYSTLHMYSPSSEYCRSDICRLLSANVSELIIIVQLCPILPPLPLVLVVISSRTGHRASETDRVRLAEVRGHCGSTGWGLGKRLYTTQDGRWRSSSQSCISLMNSQSMSELGNEILTLLMLVSDTVYVLLKSVLVLVEQDHRQVGAWRC